MRKNNQEMQTFQDTEIDLIMLVNSLLARKFLIAGFTIIFTFLSYMYALNLTQTFNISSSFTTPTSSSINSINKLDFTNETKKSVFANFLNILSSKSFQSQVFIEGGFLTKFSPSNINLNDKDNDLYVTNLLSSVTISPPSLTNEMTALGVLIESPYSVSMTGTNADSMAEYLNSLIAHSNSKAITVLIDVNKKKIFNRLEDISKERNLLLKKAERNRFSKIKRIKEEDGQRIREINDQIKAFKIEAKRNRLDKIERIKEEDGQRIREINDQIERVRYKTKEDRLNLIVELKETANLAKSLGIIENNFQLNNYDEDRLEVTIGISEGKNLPEWYLYGEKALIQRVELLENRKSDDPFIPELVTLQNQLNEIHNNNLLKTLLERQDDGPFIPELVTLNNQLNEIHNNNLLKTLLERQDDSPFIVEIVQLDIEKIKLKLSEVSLSDVNAMQLNQTSVLKPIKLNRRRIVLLGFFGSFLMSIFLVLGIEALKRNENIST